jgi:hypothetical protein
MGLVFASNDWVHRTQIMLHITMISSQKITPALTYAIQCKCPNWSQPTGSGEYYNNNHKQILMDKVETKNPQKNLMNLNFDFRKLFGFFDSYGQPFIKII